MCVSKPILEAVETFVGGAPKSILKLVFIQNLDVIYSERSDYTFLNWLGDTGALLDVLNTLAGVALANVFMMGISLDNKIIENVFRSRNQNSKN
jgi:hypothetical protein